MSAALYFCTVEPTRKLMSVSVPPRNLPLIRLPFFNSNVSAHAIDATRVSAIRNPYLSLSLMMYLRCPCSLPDLYINCRPVGTHFPHLSELKHDVLSRCARHLTDANLPRS